MMKKHGRRLLCLLMACCLLAMLCPVLTGFADTDPQSAELVWDMESLPENLFEQDWALNVSGYDYGHNDGMTDATRAEGKGVDGSTAVALTYTEKAGSDNYWNNGIYLRLCSDETAQCNWLGISELWFWLDASEFANSELQLDLMVDGVHPKLDVPYTLISGGSRSSDTTKATYSNAPYGRLVLPKGYKGWIGMPASNFNTTFGIIQNVAFTYAADADKANFPLSLYVDELRIVREDTSASALNGEGELFNKGTPAGDYSLYTDITEVHQKVKSFGASGAWWTTAVGTESLADEVLRLVFTDEGAGLNNYRHNVGASVKDDLSDAGLGMKAIPSPLTEDGRYVEDRDLGGYTVLMKLVELGTIDDFTLFMNSPPSTMTISGMTYGDPWGDSLSNLREDCFEAYASYVVDMVQLYNYLGVPVSFVSPVNEPQYDWTAGTQEGCHYSADEVQRLIELIAKELTERCKEDPTLENVRISFAESGVWADKSYVNYLFMRLLGNEEAMAKYEHIGCHSYGNDADSKKRVAKELRSIGALVQFRETEYGTTQEQPDFSIKTALEVARIMYEDLSILDVDSWAYWLAASGGCYSDGLVYYNRGSEVIQSSKRLWAMGQYARFVKNATRVGADEYGMPSKVYSTAYVNREQDSLVYVIVNDNNEDQTFSFKGLPAGSAADVYETSAIRNLELRGTMTADSGYTLPAQSVTTFVFKGMELASVVPGCNPDNPDGFAAKEDFDYAVFDKVEETEPATEPTEEATEATTAEEEKPAAPVSNILLPAGIVFGVGVLATAALLLMNKKRKSAKKETDKPEDK